MDTSQLNFSILESIYDKFAHILPKVLLFIIFIIISWLFIKIALYLVKKLLKLAKVEKLNEKLNDNELVNKLNMTIHPDKIIIGFIKWFLILVLIIIGADFLGLTALSEQTSNLISYLPQFFTALIIFIGGIYLANLLKKSIQNLLKSFDLSGAKLISLIVFYFLVIMISITALNQAGIDTDIITSNLYLIIGAFLAAFTIAFGLGSRDVIYRLLLGFYTKKNLQIGNRIKIDGTEGIIINISNIALTVKTADHKIVYPIKMINNKKIEVLE